MVFLTLFNNFFLLSLFAVLACYFKQRKSQTRFLPIYMGLFFGFVTVMGMLFPIHLDNGLFFDVRSVMLSLCAFFFGPLAALISMVIAIGCRMVIGGPGMWVGNMVCLSSTVLGLIFHRKCPICREESSPLRLLVLGLVVHVAMLLMQMLLPGNAGPEVLRQIAVPVITILPLVTLLIGLGLSGELTHAELKRRLEQSEGELRALIEQAPIAIFTSTSAGVFLELNDTMAQICGCTDAQSLLAAKVNLNSIYIVPERRRELLRLLASEGGVDNFEIELLTEDNRRVWLSLNARVRDRVSDTNFTIQNFAADITSRKQQEMKALRTLNRMRALVQIMDHPTREIEELLAYTMRETLALTASHTGYLFQYDDDLQRFNLKASLTTPACTTGTKRETREFEWTATQAWANAVERRTPELVNDPFEKGEAHYAPLREK